MGNRNSELDFSLSTEICKITEISVSDRQLMSKKADISGYV
jgi:hypothetical protein